MRIRFTPEARQAIREKRTWWQEHRDKAPRLFIVELAAVVAKLRTGADKERHEYALRRGRIVWRILMPKTRNHVYYRVDYAADEVEILLVWNAISGAAPEL